MKNILPKIDSLIDVISALALAGTFLLVFLNVVLRYVFSTGLAVSEEGARYMFVCMVFLGAIPVTHKRGHFHVDLLINVFPYNIRKMLKILVDILLLGILYIIVNGGMAMAAMTANNKSPALGIPSYLLYWLIIFSGAMMAFYTVLHLIEDIRMKEEDAATEIQEMDKGV